MLLFLEDALRQGRIGTRAPADRRRRVGGEEVGARVPFGIGFIFLLMLVGGVAAYWGDRVGMIVGRKRLSVLGLRPKHTSQVVAVGTGVFIVLITLTTLLIVSNSVRTALFGMDALQASVIELSAEVAAFELKRAELEESNEALQRTNRALEAQRSQLEEEREALAQELDSLQEQLDGTRAQLSQAREELQALQQNLEVLRFLGEQFFNVAANLFDAHFIVHKGEVLDTFLVDVTGGRDKTLQALREGLAKGEERLIQRGLGDPKTGDVLRLDRVIELVEGQMITFSAEDVLQGAAQSLVDGAAQGVESVIVQVIASTNAREGDPVYGSFRFVVNQLAFAEGTVLGSATFDPTLPKSQLYEQLWSFLEIEIARVARANLLPPDGDYGGVSVAAAYDVVDHIARYDRPVTLKAVAARDVWVYDSLDVRFEYSVESST